MCDPAHSRAFVQCADEGGLGGTVEIAHRKCRTFLSAWLCTAHGGGERCKHPGCSKGAQRGGKPGLCVAHGGGKQASIPGAAKVQWGAASPYFVLLMEVGSGRLRASRSKFPAFEVTGHGVPPSIS